MPLASPDASLTLAVEEGGWAVVGTTTSGGKSNLHVFDGDKMAAAWSRPVNKEVEDAPALEKGLYGAPTLPDGTRAELPQRDEKVWAPLAVALHGAGARKLIAVADYQGWQRWVRSSATMKEESQGLRFTPARPTITVYDETGKVVQRFDAKQFKAPFWCDMRFSADGTKLRVWTRHWRCRGLAGQATLPTDEHADTLYTLTVADGKVAARTEPSPLADVASDDKDNVIASLWSGRFTGPDWATTPEIGGPALVRLSPDGATFFAASTKGVVTRFRLGGKKVWQTDLNEAVPKSPKPWVERARATPIVPGVWQIPGGRVESDLGGQRLIEAPDGYILIEGHAGLSFESEWAALEAVGLDPRKIKYVLATHEHGDHAPGAYLWRVVTGAKFICSREMAYTLQHHIPGNSGYGLHPPVPTDVVITKDTELDLAGLKVHALRIPGHTYGSMAWHFEKSGKTFVAFGDLIMPRGVPGYSGSVNFSATDVLASLRKLRDLKVDYVLPGHGAVEGPASYFHDGIDVGTSVGWGFIRPERPDPRFRITGKNVLVVGWGRQATSAAFGDVNADGKPDVLTVSPDGGGAVVRLFLNDRGTFKDEPDREIRLPAVSEPHKIRLTHTKNGPHLLVAGKTAALLSPSAPAAKGKLPDFKIVPLDLGDGNHLRFLDDDTPLVSRRFGGFYALEGDRDKPRTHKFLPEIDGPYVDFRLIGQDLLTSYGQLYRRAEGKLPRAPTAQLPHEKDWTFLAVGDFNADAKPDAALLNYGMEKTTSARIFHGRGKAKASRGREPPELAFGDKEDAVLPLNSLLLSAKKKQTFPLVRDTPVVADWNGDGIDDLIVAHGQSDEVLAFLGGKEGLSPERIERIALEYRIHYEHAVFAADFNGDGKADLAVFGYTNTGVGAGGPPAAYIWLQ